MMYHPEIYIPIWLDLLFINFCNSNTEQKHLHSNMVRFIILRQLILNLSILEFTFQYG